MGAAGLYIVGIFQPLSTALLMRSLFPALLWGELGLNHIASWFLRRLIAVYNGYISKPRDFKLSIKKQGILVVISDPLWRSSPALGNGDMAVLLRARCARTPCWLVFIMVLTAWQQSLTGLPHPSLSESCWAANTS